MSDSADDVALRQTASGLVGVLPALNRALDRRADREFPFPKPPEVQMAMLSLVEAREGITVLEAAGILLMKPSNASTLVSQMVKAGLLRREQDALDKRVWHLHVTEETRVRLRDVEDLYCGYVVAGLNALEDDERAALAQALPALRSLARQVHPNIH
ncbi:MarR family winged helix-turn-helix transcriptional regulator [Streptomyces sp. cmx-4-7]|uniref:MarR family winged helix-turn-helix transcriptional regulator n=1 Tax=Streptomyces sp. cmx-4-7 TaxID=2790939 RepID=UPI00397F4CF7